MVAPQAGLDCAAPGDPWLRGSTKHNGCQQMDGRSVASQAPSAPQSIPPSEEKAFRGLSPAGGPCGGRRQWQQHAPGHALALRCQEAEALGQRRLWYR